MKNELKQLFQNHQGKVSDKWSLYLDEWDGIFTSFKNRPVNLFEIGIQNSGSLEVFAKYFTHAKNIIGCDINETCQELHFDDPRISIIVGDANTDEVENRVSEIGPDLDIIIDDGSHVSSDVIRSFSRYFKRVNNYGLYLIEDLHTSYWDSFGGGLYHPFSAMSFLKRLADIINYEHWRVDQTRERFLHPYEQYYAVDLSAADLSGIHSIKFLNSLCIIQKAPPDKNTLGKRRVVGVEDKVFPGLDKYNGLTIQEIPFEQHDDSQAGLLKINQFDQSDYHQLENEQFIQQLQKDLSNREKKIKELQENISELHHDVQQLNVNLSKRDAHIQQLSAELSGRERDIQYLNTELSERIDLINQLNSNVADLEQEVLNYSLSKSWQITRPLRKLMQLFKENKRA